MPSTEKLPSGKYRAIYRIPGGAKRYVKGTFTHKKRAEAAAAAAEYEAMSLGWRDPKAATRSWGEWADEWWSMRAVEAGTLKRDESPLRKHLMPHWAAVPLIDITRHDVKAWATSMARSGLAPASVKRHVALFSTSLAAAVDKEVLTVNPAFRIPIASGETDPDRFLTFQEASLLLGQFGPPVRFTPDEALVRLLFDTGLRWGEAVGLRIARVDLERRIIRVAEVWDAKLHQPKPYPKGRRRRNVPIPESSVPFLEPLLRRPPDDLVFLSNGKPYQYSNFYHRRWLPAVERSGIGHTRIHDARHSYASWLLQAGVPLAEVGRLLGHVSDTTTQRYAHLAKEVPASVLAALNGERGTNMGRRGTA